MKKILRTVMVMGRGILGFTRPDLWRISAGSAELRQWEKRRHSNKYH
jgi:hypothetical protein